MAIEHVVERYLTSNDRVFDESADARYVVCISLSSHGQEGQIDEETEITTGIYVD